MQNWQVSQAHNWMLAYTAANSKRNYYKENGLISTLVFDYLGKTNYKCAIGTSHLCHVDCTTVVRAISDLEIARNVFFILASTTHMLTITELLHKGMELSQNNLHAMVGRMSMDFFFTKHTKGEVDRGKAWSFFVMVSIWAAQTAIASMLPLVPWDLVRHLCRKPASDVQDYHLVIPNH